MDDHNIRRFNRATRVQTFGQENAADFAPCSKASALFAELDAVVRNKYSRDPDKLAAWKSASHTERAPKKKPTRPRPDK